jgi:hypothetical protein
MGQAEAIFEKIMAHNFPESRKTQYTNSGSPKNPKKNEF